MKRYGIVLISLAAFLASSLAAWAQAPAPGGATTQGFTVETLVSQLSLYLPEDATQGMIGGFGGARGAGQAAGQGANAQSGRAQGTGQTQGQAGAGGAAGFGQLFNFTRDPKLFLTKDQIAKLLPILTALKANVMPTPSKAKQVQASVDAILTAAQKAEYDKYQKQMAKAMEEIRKQFAASGASGAGNAAGQGGFAGEQAQGGQAGQAGQQRQGGAAQVTPLERRQRQLDAFIKALQERQKQIGA